ncbi:hypothetical protein [Cellulomonas sp. SG140]|uniref:hypothetical protein n=1 Tax=Cellulomonas sp. SG140 TaxID=2976536 RepID=UPI0021E75E13|nr:hypothetical protein [Cellulomonas sp. SG140]
MTKTSLADSLLALPAAPPIPSRAGGAMTRSLDVRGNVAEATINTAVAPRAELEGQARELLEQYGLAPSEWEVTGFRTSRWTMANGEEGVSARFSYGRVGTEAAPAAPDLDELFALIELHRASPITVRQTGEHAFIVALGDMQFGKIDGDGVEGTLRRAIEYINKAADALAWYRKRFDIGHIHIAWLGDHIEGFVSQGGANTWRTPLTLSEQTRLVRRVMMHALVTFAPLAERVTMVAVPGNHGDPQRFAGKGVTRYDDSHDTEALIAVSEAAAMDPARYGHVEFYTPELDEMTVTLDLAGTVTGHVHGQQFTPGKHFSWWEGQAFGGSPLTDAELLLAGHLHHFLHEEQGVLKTLARKIGERLGIRKRLRPRTFIQVPALESESTWYRHRKGVRGVPGIVIAVTKDGRTGPVEVIR